MSVIIKTSEMQYKDSNGVYHGVNAVAEKKIADQVAEIDAALTAQETRIATDISTMQSAADRIESQRQTMIASIASVAGQGTDTTLTQSGVAADAAACGSIVRGTPFQITKFVQGTPTGANNKRCTTGYFKCYPGDVISVTGNAQGQRYAIGSASEYDSGWQITDFSYIVATESNYFVNVGNTDNTAFTPSEINGLTVSIYDKSSLVEKAYNGMVGTFGKYINSESALVAPYNDLNTLPANEIICYAGSNYYPDNIPSDLTDGGFTVFSFSRKTDRTYGSLTLQVIAIRTSSAVTENQLYMRMCYGSSTVTWSPWSKVARVSDIAEDGKKNLQGSGLYINSSSLFVAPYDDLNTIPTNMVIGYSASYYPANKPNELTDGAFTVITISRSQTHEYTPVSVQLIFNRTSSSSSKPRMFFRISWASAPGVWGNWEEIQKKSDNDIFISPSMFQKLGVVGDSFASGISTEEGRQYQFSWLQMMAREYGATGYNFSTGGLTTRTWLTSSYGKTELENADACDIYFIALGINDSNPDERNVPLGTIEDMDASTLPDTFYGNMAKIRNIILAKNEHAVLCYITPMRIDGEGQNRYTPYQDAVVAIANKYGCLLVDWRDVPYKTSSWWVNNLLSAHPRVPMYSAMMHSIVQLLSKAIENNMTYMAPYPEIVNT